METNTVINTAYGSNGRGGLFSTASGIQTYADVKTSIRMITASAELVGEDVKVIWTSFETRRGHQVEKCVIEWTLYGRRQTDVFWIKRGYRWF